MNSFQIFVILCVLGSVWSRSLVKRADDPLPLDALVSQLSDTVSSQSATLTQLQNKIRKFVGIFKASLNLPEKLKKAQKKHKVLV